MKPVLRALAVSLLLLAGAIDGYGQEYIRDFYPYWRDESRYAPLLQSDTTLFYRALQQAGDLWEQCGSYTLPRVAAGRRGRSYSDEATLLNGLVVENYRSGQLLELLGASAEVRPSGAGVPVPAGDASGSTASGAGSLRLLRFNDADPLRPAYLALSFTDRNYRFGLRGSWTGDLGKGWHAAAAVDLRTGRDLHVEGVFTDAAAAALRVAKRFTDDNRIELCITLPVSVSGGRSASVEEAFAYTGNRLYNPAWGYQNGKMRNARVRRETLPMGQIGWQQRITAATTLAAAAGIETGRRSYSGLDWYDARTPLPDNYRYLPSYTRDRATEEAWRNNDTRFTQIDWDRMIAVNRLAGGEAVYALAEEVRSLLRLAGSIRFETQAGERLEVHYGLSGTYRSMRTFRQMRDLLGADYIVDIDQYLIDDDTYGNLLQNNLRAPNRRIGEGDRFGYDYTLHEAEAQAFVEVRWRADRLQAGLSAAFGTARRYRTGHYEKELFPGENSFGASRRMHFAPWSAGLYAGWNFSTRSRIELHVSAAAVAPDADALFYQPRYNNRTVDAPRTELHADADLSWRLTGPQFEWQTAVFVRSMQRLGYTSRYYDDWSGNYADRAVSGLGIGIFGIETALRWQPARRWEITAAGSLLRSRYTHNPVVTVIADADNRVIDAGSVSYLGGCRPGGVPQATATARASYFGPAGWGFRLSAGYAGGRWVEPDPLRRTQRIARQAGTTPEAFAAFVEQERLADAFTLDAAIFKRFRIGRDARLTLSLSLRNLTGDQAPYGGYESPRIRRHYAGDTTGWEPQAPYYTYVYPRSFYLSAVCRF